ncbi:MAG: DsrE family protein [Spirochaetes bacterium]|nr:DsrE family protein [Spirochaetota bacterium]
MKLAITISVTEPEVVFNALRLGNYARAQGDEVKCFLIGPGVELDRLPASKFDVRGQAESFLNDGGKILACGTCLKIRASEGSELCPLSTMKDLYELIRESDKVVSF